MRLLGARIVVAVLVGVTAAAMTSGCSSDSGGSPSSSVTSSQSASDTTTPLDTSSAGNSTPPTDGTTGPQTEITKDPCTLLNDKDVTGAGGKAGVARKDDFNGVFPGCTFGVVQLYVNVSQGYLPKAGTPVSGVGDSATYDKNFHRLYFATGGSLLLVQLSLGGDDELDTLKTLAGSVIAKL